MAYERYYDKDWSSWAEAESISYGLKQGYNPVAVVGSKQAGVNYFILFELNSYDKKLVKNVRVKANETIFRYSSYATVTGNMFPLVKVNLTRGLMYYLIDDVVNGDQAEPQFETRGVKLNFSRVISTFRESTMQSFKEFISISESHIPLDKIRKAMANTKNMEQGVKAVMKAFDIDKDYATEYVKKVISKDMNEKCGMYKEEKEESAFIDKIDSYVKTCKDKEKVKKLKDMRYNIVDMIGRGATTSRVRDMMKKADALMNKKMDEEIELDEISRKTLDSYRSKVDSQGKDSKGKDRSKGKSLANAKIRNGDAAKRGDKKRTRRNGKAVQGYTKESMSGDKEAYKKFFMAALKKFGVTEPDQLTGDKKKEFFNYIDKNWKGDNEMDESYTGFSLDMNAKLADFFKNDEFIVNFLKSNDKATAEKNRATLIAKRGENVIKNLERASKVL